MLQAIIVVSTLAGLVGRPRVKVREGWGHPGIWLLGVVAAIYLNQVLFTIYILGARHGDVSFISGSVPDGWFDIADNDPVLRWLADVFPAPDLLSVSLFRVSSFFELPFGVLAYLTVCWWFGPELYRRAAGLVWPLAVAYSTVFSLIEIRLPSPYTTQNIVIRVVSTIVVGLVVPRLTGPRGDRVTGTRDLVLFLISVGAMGALVLAVYDTALLYNLGRVGKRLPVAAVAAVVLTVTRLAAGKRGPEPGPGIDTVVRLLSWFLTYFAVPALAIRYGLIFGAPRVAAIAGVVVIGAAFVQAVREVKISTAWAAEMAAAGVAGTVAAYLAYEASAGYPELRLLFAVTALCAVAVTACAIADRAYWR